MGDDRCSVSPLGVKQWSEMVSSMNVRYRIVLIYGYIRYRVTEHMKWCQ